MDCLEKPVETGGWFEGIVTCIHEPRVFISFERGNAVHVRDETTPEELILGTVVDIRVRYKGNDSYFDILELGRRLRRSEEVIVAKTEEANAQFTTKATVFTVFCRAEVVERREGFFLLFTPIIGIAIYFFKDCPQSMKVGEEWAIKMHRIREKKTLPSNWIVHGVEGEGRMLDAPTVKRLWVEEEKEKRREGTVEEKRIQANERERRREEMREYEHSAPPQERWHTVMFTSVRDGSWTVTCRLADIVVIPYSMIGHLPVPERGIFYRIKCRRTVVGQWTAYDMEEEPVVPPDINVLNREKAISVWCYAKIDGSEGRAFTLFNEILGEATLPFTAADREMRVGDEVAALYYRVNKT
ncbi:hypothetical protein PFISCL1PPCAC_16254, partial [Pristionchus fissidentatus]